MHLTAAWINVRCHDHAAVHGWWCSANWFDPKNVTICCGCVWEACHHLQCYVVKPTSYYQPLGPRQWGLSCGSRGEWRWGVGSAPRLHSSLEFSCILCPLSSNCCRLSLDVLYIQLLLSMILGRSFSGATSPHMFFLCFSYFSCTYPDSVEDGRFTPFILQNHHGLVSDHYEWEVCVLPHAAHL